MNKQYHLTFDIDWAPDASIAMCLDMIEKKDIKATFFATHHTDMNQEIIRRGHELGIHPNFVPGSSHGVEVREVLDTCFEYAPNATLMRTHALVQSTLLLCEIFKNYPQLKTDLSVFMPRVEHVQKSRYSFDGVSFERLLYNWEDDAEFDDTDFDYTKPVFYGDITIYDFHPIHIDLNSCDGRGYLDLKKNISGQPLWLVNRETMGKFVNTQPGTRDFLAAVIDSDASPIALEDIECE